MDRLQRSIKELYAAFADIPRPRHIDSCPCCIDAKDIGTLLAKKLADISPDEISPYSSSAFLTVGDVADYLYFLPRILEISTTDEHWWPDPAITGKAIRCTNIEQWPTARVEALTDLLETVIAMGIEQGDYQKIDPWLCAIARMGFSVRPYLDMVGSSPQAVLAYFDDNAKRLLKGRLSNPFWELPCEGHDDIVNWFHSREIRQTVFDAYGVEY